MANLLAASALAANKLASFDSGLSELANLLAASALAANKSASCDSGLSDISDHFPVACLVASAPKSSTGMPKNNNTKENYMYRDTSHFDPDQFKMTLINLSVLFARYNLILLMM